MALLYGKAVAFTSELNLVQGGFSRTRCMLLGNSFRHIPPTFSGNIRPMCWLIGKDRAQGDTLCIVARGACSARVFSGAAQNEGDQAKVSWRLCGAPGWWAWHYPYVAGADA
jgi:hypothetical protein